MLPLLLMVNSIGNQGQNDATNEWFARSSVR